MFTGIVEELGTVAAVQRSDAAARFTICGDIVAGTAPGDSVCVNGVCLTVATLAGDRFTADVMPETLRLTTLASLAEGDPVNLERAATLETRLGGHIVQGHVDGVGRIIDRQPGPEWDVVTVEVPAGLARYVVVKGSIALDGVSLTVVAVDTDALTVSLIPETLRRTTLGRRAVGDPVNVEVDVLAKHIEKLIDARLERA